MKTATRLALVGASVLILTGPVSGAQSSKAERAAASRYAATKQTTAPATARTRAPVRSGTDWDFLVGVDRASSPYSHD